MLDDEPKLPLGAALIEAAEAWRAHLRADLALMSDAGKLGAAADLLALVEPTGLSQTTLTERAGLTKQAVQQLLDRLEAAGLVRRDIDGRDKRVRRVVPTDAGLHAMAERLAVEHRLEKAAREKLGKKRYTQLKKALRKLGETD